MEKQWIRGVINCYIFLVKIICYNMTDAIMYCSQECFHWLCASLEQGSKEAAHVLISYITTYVHIIIIRSYFSYICIATLISRHSVFTWLVNQIAHLQESDVVACKNVTAANMYSQLATKLFDIQIKILYRILQIIWGGKFCGFCRSINSCKVSQWNVNDVPVQ